MAGREHGLRGHLSPRGAAAGLTPGLTEGALRPGRHRRLLTAVLRSTLCIWGGWLAGCLLAVVLAAAAARFAAVEELLAPLVSAVKAVPVVSLIILILVLLDSRALPWVIAGLMAFPPVYANVLAGIRGRTGSFWRWPGCSRCRPGGSCGASGDRRCCRASGRRCRCPRALCWKAGAAAEVIGLCAGTIGEGLYTAKVYFQTAELFAWTAVIVAPVGPDGASGAVGGGRPGGKGGDAVMEIGVAMCGKRTGQTAVLRDVASPQAPGRCA